MKLECIIPVGPGHEQILNRALESVRVASLQKGPFENVGVRTIDDTGGRYGRSASRNKGVQEAESEWLFFLDADDLMHPEALHNFNDEWDAVFGPILELKDGCIAERYQVPLITSYEELLAFDPYLTLQMGHFVRREVALQHPFDEDMDTGEDWKYYLELWKNHKCIKDGYPTMINSRGHHSTGPRSATGRDWMNVVHPMIEKARAEAT